ncbi:hypothetical protein [Sandaracinus amylolyticus]|uniref:hypothetical protein n=1 Tax=Sandaracinus amylolyticus TaxID=927083 RepID=UPI001F163648|nr:hypothetical protein [Sandaracinus amylolyticus]
MRAAAGSIVVASAIVIAALAPSRASAQVFGAPEEPVQELVAQEPVAEEPEEPREESVRPSGSLGAHLLVADGPDLGGLVMLDVWAAWQWLRIGGFIGAGAIPSERDASNRVMMPLGISAAAEVLTESLALSVRLRAGLWGGATQAEKLTAGPFFGVGFYLGFLLGNGAVLNVGADAWGVIGSEAWSDASGPDAAVSASTWVIAPGIGLSWTPEEGG